MTAAGNHKVRFAPLLLAVCILCLQANDGAGQVSRSIGSSTPLTNLDQSDKADSVPEIPELPNRIRLGQACTTKSGYVCHLIHPKALEEECSCPLLFGETTGKVRK